MANQRAPVAAHVTPRDVLAVLGLPFAFLLALWVGVADLVPLIGVELAGFIWAVVALPIAGVAQVAVEELWGPTIAPAEGSVEADAIGD